MFCENRLGIKKSVTSFVYLFCPNTGTKFHEPYHSNHVIPHRLWVGHDSGMPKPTVLALTLTFYLGTRFLHVTHHLVTIIICAI